MAPYKRHAPNATDTIPETMVIQLPPTAPCNPVPTPPRICKTAKTIAPTRKSTQQQHLPKVILQYVMDVVSTYIL